jgi:molybdenum cofactor biosynthesis protein B
LGLEEHKKHAHKSVNCAVITVSTSRTKENDLSGKLIIELLESQDHEVSIYILVKDDIKKIKSIAEEIIKEPGIKAIIFNGGTGISKKDVTIEAITPLLDKILPGFGELFRHLSYEEIGSSAILSRGIAGLSHGKVIFCLPGSPNACELALNKLILPELGHIVYEAEKSV